MNIRRTTEVHQRPYTELRIHNTQSLHNNYKCTQTRDRCKEVSAEPEANDCQCMRLRELIS